MHVYLGHSTTILLLVTQLGLIDDPKLTHKNYFDLEDRKWRTSFLAPYTGNVIVMLLRYTFISLLVFKGLIYKRCFIKNFH